ncbi:MAG TPA: hypothetical protein VH518_00670 [Tepidisphaeraceae bacterium]|jgi:hypothetical protein
MYYAAALFVALFAGPTTFTRGEVTIDRTDAVIEHKTFDPKHPPADMPSLHPNEAAVTQSFFGAESHVGGEVVDRHAVPEGCQASIKVDSVHMTVRLRITVWLPKDAPPKLVKHEEGHRELAEHFYKDAESIAREEAQKLIGQTVTGTGKNCEEAGDNALKHAAQELGQRYLARTDIPCSKAQEIYDQLTLHGTNAFAESKAIEEAIRKISSDPTH